MKRSNRIIVFLLIVFAILTIVGIIGQKQGFIGGEKATKVTVDEAQRREIIQTVIANGQIHPEIEVKISSDVSGEVVELFVEEGDSVRSGQLVARIKPDSYSSVVEQMEANRDNMLAQLASARARKTQAEVNLKNAESLLEKYRQLYENGNVAEVELENYEKIFLTSQSEVDAAAHSIQALEYSVRASEAAIKEARNNLNKTSIFSPLAGIVSVLNVEQGEKVVGTLQMTGTEMMRVADFEDMEVRVKVSESDIIRVSKGDTALVEVDAFLDEQFKGVVTSIASSSQALSATGLTVSQSTTFEVRIRILRSSYEHLSGKYTFPFRPGMSATADIQTERRRDVLSVPIQAVASRDIHKDSVGTDEKLVEFVFIEAAGTVQMQEVQSGIQNDSYIEITKGLNEGDRIVTAPYNAVAKDLEDGAPVKVVSRQELYSR